MGHIVSHTFNMPGTVDNSQEVEQKAAFVALQELCMINSQASYRPASKSAFVFCLSFASDRSLLKKVHSLKRI